MAKNPRDIWLALLIFKLMPITGIDRSPSELLCCHKFKTNLPLIQQASHFAQHAKLKSTNVDSKGKDLIPIPIGSHIIYDSNPDHKTKWPDWLKGVVKDISGPGRKYTIVNDDTGQILTRTRRDIRPNKTGEYIYQVRSYFKASRQVSHYYVKSWKQLQMSGFVNLIVWRKVIQFSRITNKYFVLVYFY